MDSIINGDVYTQSIIDKEKIPCVWKDVEPLIKKVIEERQSEQTIYDVSIKLSTGEYTLWVGCLNNKIVAAAILNIISFPSKRVLNAMMFAAYPDAKSLENQKMFMKTLDDLCKRENCESIYIHGREGWGKALQESGFKKIYSVFERKI